MGSIIGIDLGTTNSVAAYWSRRRAKPIYGHFDSPIMPSVVTIERGRRIVGRDAAGRQGSGSQDVIYSIKRFIGKDYNDEHVQQALRYVGYTARQAENGEVEVLLDGKYYSPVEISAMILGQLKKDAEVVLGDEVSHAVITVPAYFGQRQKNATREAGQLAGLKVLRIINEPTAAALAYGLEGDDEEPQQILVYDLGGGTFDISILMVSKGSFDVMHVDGDNFLGGDDFDQRLVSHLLRYLKGEYGQDLSQNIRVMTQLKAQAEQAKIALSREEETRIIASAVALTDRGAPINLDLTITRSQFETLIDDLVQKSVNITLRALKDANLEVDEIDRVLLVGGSTRVPLVRNRLRKIFGDAIEIDVDPMQCVAMGAAIQATIPVEWLCQHCRTVNEGNEERCSACGQPREIADGEEQVHILCDECGKPNRQGQSVCWNCGAPVGAVGVSEEIIKINDITAKCIGVETSDPASPFAVVIDKGTLYPTDDPLRRSLYTDRFGQTFYQLPIYEAETADAAREKWEQIGVIYNDKLPPGLPNSTPIMVEMRIDGDGVLSVWSYVKRMEDETRIEGTFSFSGTGAGRKEAKSDVMEDVDFYSGFLKLIGSAPFLNKYLNPGQAELALSLAAEGKVILAGKDETRAAALLEQMLQLRKDLPVPTEAVFWASYVSIQEEHISYTERNQVERLVGQMDQAIERNDIDEANRSLRQVRQKTEELFDKIPGGLLKQHRTNSI